MASAGERRLAARIGGLALHLSGDSEAIAACARRGLAAKFEREADPDGTLPPHERARRVELVRRLYFARLAKASVAARARRAGR